MLKSLDDRKGEFDKFLYDKFTVSPDSEKSKASTGETHRWFFCDDGKGGVFDDCACCIDGGVHAEICSCVCHYRIKQFKAHLSAQLSQLAEEIVREMPEKQDHELVTGQTITDKQRENVGHNKLRQRIIDALALKGYLPPIIICELCGRDYNIDNQHVHESEKCVSVTRTTEFVFEEIGSQGSPPVLFVVCSDGSRSLANRDDIAQLLSEQVAKAYALGREAMRQEAVEAIPSVKFLKKHGAYQYDPNGQLAFGELVGQGTCREYVLDALKSLK
jgi:hypothetical protein